MLKELVEIDLTCTDKECVKPNHPHEVVHSLTFMGDSRGFVKFRDRNTGKIFYQGPGPIWYSEKEE